MAVGTGNAVSRNWYNSDGLPVYFPQRRSPMTRVYLCVFV